MRLVHACVLAFVSLGAFSTATSCTAADRALIILASSDFADTVATTASLEQLGAHVGHVIPPRTLIADLPLEAENRVSALPNVAEMHRGVTSAQGDASAGIAAWNYLLTPHAAASGSEKPLIGDAYELPRQARVNAYDSHAPGTYHTSSFMIGKVAVGVILPESNGGTENWSAERQSDVFNRIVAGLDWWVGKGGSAAHLTFYYDLRFGVPTQYEPISMDGPAGEGTWVSDVFANMGYTSGFTHIDRARTYDNDIRRAYNADWAVTFIVVDSLNDPDGEFADGRFAWAYILGPYAVMTYDNDSYTISRMSVVVAHETGHLFGAADEYCAPNYSCCDFRSYGYLSVYNGNCQKDNPASVPCMMRECADCLCCYTSGQVGWQDSDCDGKPDPVDNPVGNAIYGQMDSQTSPWDVSIRGKANDLPCPSVYGAVTINKIAGVRFRIDSGDWCDAEAADGAFDEDVEEYVASASGLAAGDHLVQTQAFSTSGNASDVASCVAHAPQFGYSAIPIEFDWIDPSLHTALLLADDAVSPPQTIPFEFSFYGTTYNQFFVGSNGVLGFAADNLASYANAAIPSVAEPNAAIYAYWDDLDPSAGGSVKVGVVGVPPHRKLVVSWVGVPHFLTSSCMTFQAVLCEGSGDTVLQYLEVQPDDELYGAGRSATVGIENAAGTRAAQYSLNGRPLLSNGQAILLTMIPPISLAKRLPDGVTIELAGRAVTYASADVFYIEDDSRTSGIRVVRVGHGLSRGMKAYVKGTLATDANGERCISATIAARCGDGSVKPLFVTNRALRPPVFASCQCEEAVNTLSCQGGAGEVSLVGLLVRTTGRVTTVGPGYVYIDDGSGLRDGTDTAGIANVGVRILCDPDGYSPGDILVVTGVCSCFAGANGGCAPQILVNGAVDVNVERSYDLGTYRQSAPRQVWVCWR